MIPAPSPNAAATPPAIPSEAMLVVVGLVMVAVALGAVLAWLRVRRARPRRTFIYLEAPRVEAPRRAIVLDPARDDVTRLRRAGWVG